MADVILPSEGDNIIRTKDIEANNAQDGLAHFLFQSMKRHKSKVAQIDAQTGRSDTYETFLRESVKIAISIRSRGIKPDDIICFCSENQPDVFIAYFASILIGAVTSALDPNMSKADMEHLLSQVPPKMIFTTPTCEKLLEEVVESINQAPDIVIFGQSERNTSFDKLSIDVDVKDEEDFQPYRTKDVFKTAVIFFSSGTTGLPKGICVSHYSLMCNAQITGPLAIRDDQVVLGFATVYWVSSVVLFFSVMLEGKSRLLIPEFDADKVLSYMQEYKVNNVICATNLAASLQKALRKNGLKLTSFNTFLIGGSKVPEELLKSLRAQLPHVDVFQGYGMSEIGGFCTVQQPQAIITNPTTCGTARQGIWYKIVDPETEEILGPYQPGELRFKTKLQMNGYYNLDSSSAWDDDGWLRTGDILYYDKDNFFYFVDRLKAVIKYKGIHVQSTMLEEILLKHPGVGEAVVIGLPHPEDEEHPMGFVVLADGAGNVTPEELRSYVDEKVDNPKKLRGGVRIVKELPLTVTGKFDKRELKRRICEEMKILL